MDSTVLFGLALGGIGFYALAMVVLGGVPYLIALGAKSLGGLFKSATVKRNVKYALILTLLLTGISLLRAIISMSLMMVAVAIPLAILYFMGILVYLHVVEAVFITVTQWVYTKYFK